MRSKNLKTPFLHLSPLLRLSFIPNFSFSELCKGAGNGSYSQFIACWQCCSFLLMLFPCSSVRSYPKDTVFHKLHQCGYFLQAAVLQEFLKCGTLPRTAVLEEWTAPGSQVLSEDLLWHVLSMGFGFLQSTWTCSSIGSSIAAEWISTPPWTSMWGTTLDLYHGLQQNVCSGTWSTTPHTPRTPPHFLVSGTFSLLHIFTPLCHSSPCTAVFTLS